MGKWKKSLAYRSQGGPPLRGIYPPTPHTHSPTILTSPSLHADVLGHLGDQGEAVEGRLVDPAHLSREGAGDELGGSVQSVCEDLGI